MSKDLCNECEAKLNAAKDDDWAREKGKAQHGKTPKKEQATPHQKPDELEHKAKPIFEAAITNKALPCNDNSPCPYSNDMECDTCKAMTGEERDALEKMDDMKVEVDTEKAKKITRERR